MSKLLQWYDGILLYIVRLYQYNEKKEADWLILVNWPMAHYVPLEQPINVQE